MSYRECILVYYPVDVEKYLNVLEEEFGARPNPNQPGTYLIGNPSLPFYRPRLIDEYMSILGFNKAPISSDLIKALLNHPELVPGTVIVNWTAEQELIARGKLEIVGRRLRGLSWKER